MRPRRSLGVVLDGKDRQLPMAESLNRPVVQIQVRDLESRCARYSIRISADSESVVLRRDQNAAIREIAHGVIPATVPIWKLDG
jgi:hypothetical protein